MRVSELMTEEVLTIGPEAPIRDVAKILVDNGISGLPVCDIEGHVLGVISEGDILYKEHDPRRGALVGRSAGSSTAVPTARRYAKTEALDRRRGDDLARDHDRPVESVDEAARIMCERRVNRLPVVKDDRLVGIVTRADLVRAFTRTDAEIERELKEDVLARTMWIDAGKVEVTVQRRARRTRAVGSRPGATSTSSTGWSRAFPESSASSRAWTGSMTTPRASGGVPRSAASMNLPSHAFEIEQVRSRLEAGNGGYEVVHASPGLEVGVYVLVAPEPDRQQPHEDDELYVVLEGSGVLDDRGQGGTGREGTGDLRPCTRGAPVHRLRGPERARDLRPRCRSTLPAQPAQPPERGRAEGLRGNPQLDPCSDGRRASACLRHLS